MTVMQRFRRIRIRRGMTLIELIVAFSILLLLTSMAVPLARYRVRRQKETELRLALREISTAIDKFKDASDQGALGPVKLDTDGYPESLEQLVKGVDIANSADGKKIKFLRRIPIDPFTGTRDWGIRSTRDEPDSLSWGRQNVFSVYSKTYERAPDGTPYNQW
jgi:general secretion pathway protein G